MTETLQKLLDQGGRGTFDIAFIDADKPGYDDYYEKCLQLLRPGGLILLDNMLLSGKAANPKDRDPNATALRRLGATVEHVVCAIDRSSPGENRLDELGVTINPLLTRADLDRAAG